MQKLKHKAKSTQAKTQIQQEAKAEKEEADVEAKATAERRQLGRSVVAGACTNDGDALHGWVDRQLGLPFPMTHSTVAAEACMNGGDVFLCSQFWRRLVDRPTTMQVLDGGGSYGSGLLPSTGAPSLFLRYPLSLLVLGSEEPKSGDDGKKRRWRRAVKAETRENFENNWNGFVNTYCLEDNEWLQGMWNNCRYWVPVYLKGDFGARISSTQRSESVHFFFDKYLNPQTTLGGRKNFDSMNKVVPCCSFNSEIKERVSTILNWYLLPRWSKWIFKRHSTINNCYMVDHRLLHVKHYDRLQNYFIKVVEAVVCSKQYSNLLDNLLKEFHAWACEGEDRACEGEDLHDIFLLTFGTCAHLLRHVPSIYSKFFAVGFFAHLMSDNSTSLTAECGTHGPQVKPSGDPCEPVRPIFEGRFYDPVLPLEINYTPKIKYDLMESGCEVEVRVVEVAVGWSGVVVLRLRVVVAITVTGWDGLLMDQMWCVDDDGGTRM
ncbi:hypothetical protein Ahy_A09g044332 [Arachis hypogaea]|uniref:Protein FAR1-RELATED SEQUENCE n=1 Tax=Arachis hypogaea TaxID=3818 RepID=A0A445BJX7_ARAHY|nr:hypothetical protein Ahy_A09g044332 [Arachis hypogaea]